MSDDWSSALSTVARLLNVARVEWMLIGSAATALRGAPIVPGDIDISMSTPGDVHAAAKVLPNRAEPSPSGDPLTWYSSQAQPTLTFGDSVRWTFGRWMVAGVKVELAHIADPSVGALFVETVSTTVWDERSVIPLDDTRIPVVPIEAQIATMIARGQTERLDATLAALGPESFNSDLLRRALADRQTRDNTSLRLPQQISVLVERH